MADNSTSSLFQRLLADGQNGTTDLLNNATNTSTMEDMLAFDRTKNIVIPIIFGLIAVCGFVGNLLVIIVVVSNKQMRNSTNLLIINLAIADIVFILICVPFTAISYTMPWPLGKVFCKIYQYVINVTAYASVYTLVLMSLDRYLAVVHPISSMTIRTERNTAYAIITSWMVICSVNTPVLIIHDIYHYEHNGQFKTACIAIKFMHSLRDTRIFYGCFFAFAYILPLTLVCILYGFMLKRLLYGVVPGCQQSAESMRSKRRVTRMVVIVVLFFALSWLPLQIVFMIRHFGQDLVSKTNEITFATIQMTSNCLMYANSCVNPFLYAFLSENFRKSFVRLLCCGNRFQQPIKLELEKTTARGAGDAVTMKTYTAPAQKNGTSSTTPESL